MLAEALGNEAAYVPSASRQQPQDDPIDVDIDPNARPKRPFSLSKANNSNRKEQSSFESVGSFPTFSKPIPRKTYGNSKRKSKGKVIVPGASLLAQADSEKSTGSSGSRKAKKGVFSRLMTTFIRRSPASESSHSNNTRRTRSSTRLSSHGFDSDDESYMSRRPSRKRTKTNEANPIDLLSSSESEGEVVDDGDACPTVSLWFGVVPSNMLFLRRFANFLFA